MLRKVIYLKSASFLSFHSHGEIEGSPTTDANPSYWTIRHLLPLIGLGLMSRPVNGPLPIGKAGPKLPLTNKMRICRR
jgi:hypothetical protein